MCTQVPQDSARATDTHIAMIIISLPLHSPSSSRSPYQPRLVEQNWGGKGGNLLGLGNSSVCKVPAVQVEDLNLIPESMLKSQT